MGSAALLSVGTTASAVPIPGMIDASATGSIIIHSHADDESSANGQPAGAALAGVDFEVHEVLQQGVPISLVTSQGWQLIEGVTPANLTAKGLTLGKSVTVETGADGIALVDKIDGVDLGVGVYLVEQVSPGDHVVDALAVPFLVTIPNPAEGGWEYDVDVYPKNVLTKLVATKVLGTPDQEAVVGSGARVPSTISLPLPQGSPIASVSFKEPTVTGLTDTQWGAVKIDNTALAAEDYVVDGVNVSLTATGLAKLNAALGTGPVSVSAELTSLVTGAGKLNTGATVTVNGVPVVALDVTTSWARLDVTKVDSVDRAKKLDGAKFELYAVDRATLLATASVDSLGAVSLTVWVGNGASTTREVYLKEILAPQGYVLPADPWTGPITLTAGGDLLSSVTAKEIANYKAVAPQLPLTGSTGTLVWSIGGALLTLVGAVVLVSLRRRSSVAPR